MTYRAPVLAILATAALAGCGSSVGDGADTTIPGDAEPEPAGVVEDWAAALNEGDIQAAAELFALPSEAQNGPAAIEIETIEDARLFNRSLPCGVEVLEIEGGPRGGEEAGIVTATFELTERPGAGECGPGTGSRARTAFKIEDGRIAAWLRVPAGGEDGGGPPLESDVV